MSSYSSLFGICFHFVYQYDEVEVVCCYLTALPVLFKPPTVQTSSNGRYLVIQWPEWLSNITGNGTGPVVSHTLQGIPHLDNGYWQNLVTKKQQPLSATIATTADWFTHIAEG